LGLVYIPYAEMVYLNRLNIRPAVFCLAAAGVVLRSAVLRPDSFAAAGSELTPSNHPDLFRLVESVMGIGSQRVMALGVAICRTENSVTRKPGD
jgi:hypothetical protein